MGKRGFQGAMTVFFSVTTVLFLALIFSFAESARIQGAKAKAACVLDLGLFSVFGEYERALLEKFDVFGVHASAKNGDFVEESLRDSLERYIRANTDYDGFFHILAGNSLFPMALKESVVTGYGLLTDRRGEVFRDQVVENKKLAFGTEAAAGFLEAKQQAEDLEQAGEEYQKKEGQATSDLKAAKAEAERQEEEKRQAEGDGQGEVIVIDPEAASKPENPLDLIEKIKKMGILGIVMKDPGTVSEKTVRKADLPSGRTCIQGNMSLESIPYGLIEEGIFQEYLFETFSCIQDEKQEGILDYELEYLLAGKETDRENLKSVVNRLLLFREGANFLYVLSNSQLRHGAEVLAAALSGGLPVLTAAFTAALLAAWAYGESLMDVRILLSGGKVPLVKSRETFRLSLENLGKILEVLEECDKIEGEGLDYRGYLKLLYLSGNRDAFPMRALDLVEGRLRKEKGMEHFRADHCVTAMRAETTFLFAPVFAKGVSAFLGVRIPTAKKQIAGEIFY